MAKKIITNLIALSFVFMPAIVLADTFGSGLLDASVAGVGLEKSVETSVANIISAVLTIVGTIFLILTVYAGVLWMTAAGNEERITKAKQILVAAAIGLFVVMSAYTITYFVTKKVGGASRRGGGGGGSSAPGCCSYYVKNCGGCQYTMSESACMEKTSYSWNSAGACNVDEGGCCMW